MNNGTEKAQENKRNITFISIMVAIFLFGLFCAQSVFWYQTGTKGKTWTEHEGYSNEVIYTRSRAQFPFVKVKNNKEDTEE